MAYVHGYINSCFVKDFKTSEVISTMTEKNFGSSKTLPFVARSRQYLCCHVIRLSEFLGYGIEEAAFMLLMSRNTVLITADVNIFRNSCLCMYYASSPYCLARPVVVGQQDARLQDRPGQLLRVLAPHQTDGNPSLPEKRFNTLEVIVRNFESFSSDPC